VAYSGVVFALYLETGGHLFATMASNDDMDTGMYAFCRECSGLWWQYSIATVTAIRLDNKLRFAALQMTSI
jgi:hypothetical protein